MEGRQVSHYLVLDRLGAGGMGEVYRAEDLDLKRTVALKFLPQSLTDSGSGSATSRAEALGRFRQEAQVVAALNHPGICTIFEIGEYQGQPFIAMELLEGRTLRDRLAEIAPKPLSVTEVLDLGIQIAEALEAAHQQGVIHRDLKPANLFVTTRGWAKILDFGLAKRKPLAREKAGVGAGGEVDQASAVSWGLESSPTISAKERALTNPGSLVGTIAYMSPEQALGERVDERTDIFSLGAVLYEMSTGQRAFTGPTPLAVSNAIINRDPAPAGELNPQLPPDLIEVIRKCLEKNPGDRYRTAGELRADLELLRVDSPARRIGVRKRPAHAGRAVRARAAWLLGLAAVLAAMLVALAVPQSRSWLAARAGSVLNPSHQPALPSRISLVVLPFNGAPADAQLTAFGNGLADELTARLAQLTPGRSFQVTAASEVRDKRIKTLDQARRDFGANLGLEIGLQRAEGVVQVSYSIIDARSGQVLRADSIAAAESDLVSLEDRVVESAARSLDLGVRSEEQRAQSFQGTRSSNAYSYYLQGTGYLELVDDPAKLDSALETLRAALRLDPQFGLAAAALGEAYWKKYKASEDRQWIDLARAACGHAIELGNAGAEGHECLGTLANGTGDYAGAAAQFQLAVQLDATSDRAYTDLAGAYMNLNRFGDAEKTYQRAIRLRPNYWYGYNKLGILYLEQQDYEKARQMFEKVIELVPDSFRGYVNLGGTEIALDDDADAISNLEHSLAILPSEVAYSDLGTAYFMEAKYDQASRDFEQAIKLNSGAYDYWGFLGDAYYYSGHHQQAMDAYRRAVTLGEEALKVNPNDTGVLGLVAGYYAMLGDRDRALSRLDRALTSGQPDKDLLFNAAEVYNEVGDQAVAMEWLAKAIAAGYSTYLVSHVPSLGSLHNNPRYRQLLRQK